MTREAGRVKHNGRRLPDLLWGAASNEKLNFDAGAGFVVRSDDDADADDRADDEEVAFAADRDEIKRSSKDWRDAAEGDEIARLHESERMRRYQQARGRGDIEAAFACRGSGAG